MAPFRITVPLDKASVAVIFVKTLINAVSTTGGVIFGLGHLWQRQDGDAKKNQGFHNHSHGCV